MASVWYGKWIWLFPLTYVVHIAEEYWGGFPAWASRFSSVSLAPNRFLQLNAYALTVMALCVVLVLTWRSMNFLLVGLGVAVVINVLAHALGCVVTRSYSPGVISAIFLWLPLSGFTLVRAWRNAGRSAFWVGIVVGVSMHGLVSLAAFYG